MVTILNEIDPTLNLNKETDLLIEDWIKLEGKFMSFLVKDMNERLYGG